MRRGRSILRPWHTGMLLHRLHGRGTTRRWAAPMRWRTRGRRRSRPRRCILLLRLRWQLGRCSHGRSRRCCHSGSRWLGARLRRRFGRRLGRCTRCVCSSSLGRRRRRSALLDGPACWRWRRSTRACHNNRRPPLLRRLLWRRRRHRRRRRRPRRTQRRSRAHGRTIRCRAGAPHMLPPHRTPGLRHRTWGSIRLRGGCRLRGRTTPRADRLPGVLQELPGLLRLCTASSFLILQERPAGGKRQVTCEAACTPQNTTSGRPAPCSLAATTPRTTDA